MANRRNEPTQHSSREDVQQSSETPDNVDCLIYARVYVKVKCETEFFLPRSEIEVLIGYHYWHVLRTKFCNTRERQLSARMWATPETLTGASFQLAPIVSLR